MRMKLARLALAPLLALASLLACAAPAAAGPTNGGNSGACAKADPTTIATYSSPQQVSISGTGGISCPMPGNSAPGSFGKGGTRIISGPPPAPPPAGTACDLQLGEWVQFRLNGSTPEFQIWGPGNPASGQKLTVDANNPGFVASGWSSAFNAYGVTIDLYNQAGTQDVFVPIDFVGKWTGNGWTCQATQGAGTGWVTQCFTNTLCFQTVPTGPTVGVPITVGALPIDLAAFVQGQFTGGNITSLPTQPRPSLVNAATCFYISNMTVTGGGNPLQPRDWEQIVQGPLAGPDGRHVYFVLLYHVYLIETDFDFGDGTTTVIGPGGASPTPVPQACGDIANQQYLIAHTYTRYTPAGSPFQVKVTHQFGADVTELWQDSFGPHSQTFGQVVQVPVQTNPFPFDVNVVQEEGVPIG